MSFDYSEDSLVEQPTIELFSELCWETANCSYEKFGEKSTLGRETTSEVILVPRLREALAPEMSEEGVSLLVVLRCWEGRMPGKPYYLPEVKDSVPTGAYTINPDIVAMGIALRSLYLVSQYIPLTDAEAQAIAYHDGMYVPDRETHPSQKQTCETTSS